MSTFRYLFCDEFFGEESMFYDIFAGMSNSVSVLNLPSNLFSIYSDSLHIVMIINVLH